MLVDALAHEGERPAPDPAKVARAKAVRRGYRIGPEPTRRAPKLTDAQVLECRTRYEFNGEKSHVLAKEYGTSARYMLELLTYGIRSKLIPRRPE